MYLQNLNQPFQTNHWLEACRSHETNSRIKYCGFFFLKVRSSVHKSEWNFHVLTLDPIDFSEETLSFWSHKMVCKK